MMNKDIKITVQHQKMILDIAFRGVRNPMKISDIGFLKTEPN